MSEADLLLFTSWESVDLVMTKYPDSWRKRVIVLPHAFDPALYPTESPKANGKDLIIRYLGNFFWQRNPRALAEAVAILYRTQPRILENVKIELTGRWVGHRRWNPCSLGAPPNLVPLKEPVGYLDSLRLMREADLLMVIDAPFDSNVFFPSKLVDYMGSGRPILAFTPEGTSADIVRALGGWVAPSSSPERMAATLAEAITALRDGRRPSPQEGYVERFSARSVASAFDGLALSISRPSPFPA